MENILEVKNLSVSFNTAKGVLRAVRDISFSIRRGETLAVVGESGSGKSVTSKAVLGILSANATEVLGEVIYDGKNLLSLSEEELCGIRGNRISMVFQDPMSALNPIVKIGKQISEGVVLKNRKERKEAFDFLKCALQIFTDFCDFRRLCKDKFPQSAKLLGWMRGACVNIDEEKLRKEIEELSGSAFLHEEAVRRFSSSLGIPSSRLSADIIANKIAEAHVMARRKITRSMAKEVSLRLMKEVGISEPEKRYEQYPFEFSGGMRQRIVIAIALAADPDILICDEPTTALDVTIQAQILELIERLKAERSLSVIFITHDLGVVARVADRIAVMYAGKIVEEGEAEEIFYEPKHPYTWALLSSMPDLETEGALEAIPGTAPDMTAPPIGDAFAERSKYAMKIDYMKEPPFFKVSDTHRVASWLMHPDAPKVQPPVRLTKRIEKMKKKREEFFGVG